ncbi:MAG: glutamine amidotransferase, partial [Gammaproteobacteria bacterium]
VKEERYRILYVEGEPRWEYKFMRRALAKDPSVELVSLLRVSQNKFYRQGVDSPEELEDGFPVKREDLFAYHALIIGSIEAASFTPEQQLMIHDFVSERGGSLLMIAGLNGLGAGGWGNSMVSEALPARLSSSDSGLIRKRARAVLTPAGLRTAMLKLSEDADENNRLWQGLPEIADYQPVGSLKPASVSLVNVIIDGSQHPLMVAQPYGNGHSYIFATGGTWRWQMSLPHQDQRHETFWRQFLRELVINSPGRFNLLTQVVADRIRINAELRDKAFNPERELRLTAVVSPEHGENMTIELQPSPEYPGLMTGEFSADQSGLYSIEAISRREDEPVDSARVAIHHDTGTAEYFSLRRNQTLLDQLAVATGGRSWSPADIDRLEEAIRYSPAGITERDLRPVWDAPLIFLLLILLKATEWLLRRRWKTI